MNIFNKLFSNKDNYIDDFECFHPSGKYQTKLYLDEILSPLINEHFDLYYDGQYTWYSDFIDHKRLVISLFLLKGDSAILQWGYNFDFIPEIKSNKIQYYRTDKRINAQLRDMPKEFIDFEDFKYYRIPLHSDDLNKLKLKVETIWKALLPNILGFLSKDSIEELLTVIDYQIDYKKYYKLFSPEQQYIKAFILARQGKNDKAIKLIQETYMYQQANQENKNKLLRILTECNDK